MAEPRRSYVVTVRGTLGAAVLNRIDRFVVSEVGMNTVLVSDDADQADLFGMLHEFERLGIELVSIKEVTGTD